MLWKERRATHRGGLAWLAGRPLALVVIIIMGCFLFEAMIPAFREMLESYQSSITSFHSRRYLNGMIRDMGMYVFALWMIVVACAGAVSVTEEKESDTWISLTATLLTAREIILGKIFGALWSSQWIGLALLAMIGACLIAGALHPLGALLAVVGLLIYGTFAATLGIAVSLQAKNSARAILWTITILALINMGVPAVSASLSGSMMGESAPLIWTAAAPFAAPYVERVSLISPEDFHPASHPGYRRIGSDPSMSAALEYMYVIFISFTLYGIAAFGLAYRSIRRFDRAVDRPRRSRTASQVAAIQPAS